MPTKEQWVEIERQMSGSFGRVVLACDGYKVDAVVERVGSLKYGIAVYVDGLINGEWLSGESEIPRKFHQEKKRFVNRLVERENYVKMSKMRCYSKEERALFVKNSKRTFSLWSPCWTSAKSFCRHIRKTCTSIEIVEIGY